MGACRTCHAPVLWAKTIKGRTIPVDPTPVPDGNLIVEHRDGKGSPVFRVLRKGEPTAADRYRTHFESCPNADQHRTSS
jgi:hypothetical protein